MATHTPPYGTPPYSSAGQGPRKVAIPRLRRPSQTATLKDRRRVPRACTSCRSHKIKCTGDTPSCKHCEATGRECVYVLPRKDRLKIVTDRCVQMATLLNGLKTYATEEDVARISDVLDAVEEDISETRQASAPSNPDTDADESKAPSVCVSPTETLDPLDTESLDLLDEDLLRDEYARATGFVGKSSEVQWLRSIALQMARPQDESTKSTHTATSERRASYVPANVGPVSAFTFYLDCDSVDPDLNIYLDPYELPLPDTADRLLECYMAKAHDSFPILPKQAFQDHVRKYFDSVRNGLASRLSPKWQAILNMVFAIGSRYSHLVKASWRGDERDHIMYQAKARALALNESTLTNHPDVPQIQMIGLLSFYYLSIGQISRAWIVLGIALRFAYALGLHVRNEDRSATPTKREMLVRIWWSLYSLERLLGNITGRPSNIVDTCCSVPLPLPFTEEQMDRRKNMPAMSPSTPSPTQPASFRMDPPRKPAQAFADDDANSGSHFRAVVQIGTISQSILSSLYSAGTRLRSIEDMQHDIVQLGQRLDQWVTALPRAFNFQMHPIGTDPSPYIRERMILQYLFSSARILLTRPCLGSLGQLKNENVSETFVRRMANMCLDAAKVTTDSVPDQPNLLFIYEKGPWWCIVHNMMQAVSVFLLGLSYSSPGSHDCAVLSCYVKKLIRWLRAMQNPIGDRAYQVAFNAFEAIAGRLSIDLSDLWIEDAMALPKLGEDAVYGDTDILDTDQGQQAAQGSFYPTEMSASVPSSLLFSSLDPLITQGYVSKGQEPLLATTVFNELV